MAYKQKVSPCLNCKNRSVEPVNCHTICEKYAAFQDYRGAIIDAKTSENELKHHGKSKRKVWKKGAIKK